MYHFILVCTGGIGLLREKPDALQGAEGGPAAAVLSPPVPAAAPPAKSAPAVHPAPPTWQVLALDAAPPLDRAELDLCQRPRKRRHRTPDPGQACSRLPDQFIERFTEFAFKYGRDRIARGNTMQCITNRAVFAALKNRSQ